MDITITLIVVLIVFYALGWIIGGYIAEWFPWGVPDWVELLLLLIIIIMAAVVL